MNVQDYIFQYETFNPGHYRIAAEHLFECNCMDCIVFLYTTGNHIFNKEDPIYTQVQKAEVEDDELSPEQIKQLRYLFDTYL